MTKPQDRLATGACRLLFFVWLGATILVSVALVGGLLWLLLHVLHLL